MAADPKKRQKKLEKQKAKRKAKHHELTKERNLGLGQQFRRAAAAPVLECLRTDALLEKGIGQVVVSRQMPDGTIAAGVFLLDMYCLGVKNAFGRFVNRFEYRTKLASPSHFRMVEMEPAAARKLVEAAVTYAQDLGFQPHPDYQSARLIFGDIDPSQCLEEFEFGKDGLPFFVAGPHDPPARCRQVLATLEHNCGQGNYHYLMPIDPSSVTLPPEEDDSTF